MEKLETLEQFAAGVAGFITAGGAMGSFITNCTAFVACMSCRGFKIFIFHLWRNLKSFFSLTGLFDCPPLPLAGYSG